jgi:hypothetical protein
VSTIDDPRTGHADRLEAGGTVKARSISLIIVAFLLGALAAGGIGVRVIREVNTTEDATSLPQSSSTTTIAELEPQTYQVDPFETLVSSTSLTPVGIGAGEGKLSIDYDLVTLSPHEGVEPIEFFGNFGAVTVIDNADLDHIYPREWAVETIDGVIRGGPANPSTRVARFDVNDGFSISEIRSVTITKAFAPFAVSTPFTLSVDDPVVDVAGGVSVELLNISDQGSSTIVQIGIDLDDHELASFFVTGDGPGWRSSVFEAEGRLRVNLTWIDGELPSAIPLMAIGTVWVPIAGEFPVSLEGIT